MIGRSDRRRRFAKLGSIIFGLLCVWAVLKTVLLTHSPEFDRVINKPHVHLFGALAALLCLVLCVGCAIVGRNRPG